MESRRVQELTKIERLILVAEYAKSIGFSNANPVYWRENQEEIGAKSPFEQPEPNEVVMHEIGIALGDNMAAVFYVPHQNESEDDQHLVFDDKDQAEAFLRAEGGAK